MALKEILLASILTWPSPWYPPGRPNPETPAQYKQRISTIAEAVALESKGVKGWRQGRRAIAAATLTVWYGETRFAYEVHELGTSRWGQDLGKAKCLGQIHVTGLVPKSEWKQMVGSDLEATRRCARATMRVLAAMARMCSAHSTSSEDIAKIFSAYGTGRGCTVTSQAKKRARRFQRLLRHI